MEHKTSLLESCSLGYVVHGCQHTRGSGIFNHDLGVSVIVALGVFNVK